MSAGEKQIVEIVRILLQDPQLLIMDERTSVLTPQEVTNLFKTLDALIKEGRTILYITHKLEEVISLCDEVSIMRNGQLIDSCLIENQTAESLASKMLGERLGEIKTDYSHVSNKINFKVSNLSVKYNDPFLISPSRLSIVPNHNLPLESVLPSFNLFKGLSSSIGIDLIVFLVSRFTILSSDCKPSIKISSLT